nr:hypothetical protein [Tanacetum cinerariifolium]
MSCLLEEQHADVPSQQELDMLFGPLYDEFFNAGSNPSTNIQSTSAPSTHTNVNAEEKNNDQGEEGEHIADDEFTNPFCAPTQEEAESSSHNIAGSESRPPMLNKENYVPWSKMIPEPGDANREITITETFYLQTDDQLSDKELKQIEADDQAIQTILLGLPEDIYAAVDSCETAQEI